MITNLKGALKGILSKKEFEHLKTSFDLVGDIAIIEIDEELVKKEIVIAEALLGLHKNIKVVCKKAGIHEGTYRTQELKVLAGEDRKETLYKENGVHMELDVEKVYFSPRLSTERLRVAELVRPGENILAMFSGCGPYPLVILRNQPDVMITSVEINPDGVEYQKKNLILNKNLVKKLLPAERRQDRNWQINEIQRRVNIIHGNVKTLELKGRIGLKSIIDRKELSAILKAKPPFVEIQLLEGDIEKRFDDLLSVLNELEEDGIDIMVHAPIKSFYEKELGLYNKEDLANTSLLLSKFSELKSKYKNILGFVIHPCYDFSTKDSEFKELNKNLKKLKNIHKRLFPYLYLENLPLNLNKDREILEVAKSVNLCFDINHYFMVYKDNDRLNNLINKLPKNTYYHIADSKGGVSPHSLPVGWGDVDFKRIHDAISFGCIEVLCKNYLTPHEVFDSYEKFLSYGNPKFDRILMPLPKSAEDFLDAALSYSKRGTVVHFYDFLEEDNFKEAEQKIIEACKSNNLKWNFLSVNKCGQHAPRVFRICVDFRVL
jgi:tRNA G37 N-methylase Trm5/sugar phosphate isomerase/epimerase